MTSTDHDLAPQGVTPPVSAGGRAWPATVAILAVVAAIGVSYVALSTAWGQRVDERAMSTVVAGRDTQLAVLSLLGYVSIGAVVLVTGACVVLALVRARLKLAIAAVGVIVGANLTTQVLKHVVLERADVLGGVAASNSLPSGHTTVVAAGVGALCLVSPLWLRTVVVPAGAFAVGLTGTSTVVAGWHRPADVIVALAVTLAWTAAAAAWVGGRHRLDLEIGVLAIIGAAVGLVALVAIGVRPSYGWSGFGEAAVVLAVVSAAIAVFATLTASVAPLAERRSQP